MFMFFLPRHGLPTLHCTVGSPTKLHVLAVLAIHCVSHLIPQNREDLFDIERLPECDIVSMM
jgi:hypothetical protein